VTDKTTKVVIGLPINLKAEVTGGTATSYQWTIGGTIVKDYETTATLGKVTEMGLDDKKTQEIKYYWTKGDTGIAVSCTAQLSGGGSVSGTAQFDVGVPDAPCVVHPATVRLFSIPPDVNAAVGLNPAIGFGHGDVTIPYDYEGDLLWVQIAVNGPFFVTVDGVSSPIPPLPCKDGPFPNSMNPTTKDGALVTLCETLPNGKLSVVGIAALEEHFEMYLMFRPKKPNGTPYGIVVPLKKCAWFWKATATRTSPVPRVPVVYSLTGTGTTPNPTLIDSVGVLPLWVGKIGQ
jgi:hypothetical protein